MRKLAMLVVGVALVAAAVAVAATEHQVSLTAGGPQPVELRVVWGDSVAFTNADTATQTLQIPSLSVATDIAAGATFKQVFSGRAGTYTFRQRLGTRLHTGRIIVDVSGDLTIKVSPTSLRYGQPLKITGQSPFGESPVALESQPVGETSGRIPLATVTPAADGSFTTTVRLERSGRIVALVANGQLRSSPLLVPVVPVLSATASPRRAASGRFVTLKSQLRPATAAASVTLERYDPDRNRWSRFKSAKVPSTGAVAFSFRVVKGVSRFRVIVPRNAARNGYTTAVSKDVTVTGT